ncbi:MAG TPA: hypothetical protein VFQ35_17310, partial [Polyangiaceae bacterium]|nr:hypothetical protein [Polyangiaceae bacterium]
LMSLGERGGEAAPAFGIGWAAAVRSLVRFSVALLFAGLLGVLFVRLEIGTRRVGRLLAPPLGALGASLPAVFLARAFGANQALWPRETLAVAVTSFVGAALLSRLVLSLAERAASRPSNAFLFRTELSALPSLLPWLTSALFSTELALDLDGVAESVLTALSRSEVSAGVTCAVVCAALTAALVSFNATRPLVSLDSGPTLIAVDSDKRRRMLWRGGFVVLLLVGYSVLSLKRSGGGSDLALLSQGARALLYYGLVTLVVSTVLGISLGALAASGPVALDRLFIVVVEIGASLPNMLWAAALSRAAGSGLVFAIALGCLRAPDLAWLYRAELMRLAAADSELGARSLGRLPLSIYLRSRLWPAAALVMRGAALTPAWALGIAASAEVAGFSASAGEPGWERLFALATPARVPFVVLAALGLAAATWFLVWAFGGAPRRVGIRSTRPPPPLPNG